MHYQLELIMPPTEDIEGAVDKIMKPFCEHDDPAGGFWDFYVIGGRFAGNKMLSMVDKDRLEQFNQELEDRGVTVSGLRVGKPELSPADQRAFVDRLWAEWFPGVSPGDVCPLFNHYNDQYTHNLVWPDVTNLKSVNSSHTTCERVLFARDNLEAEFMCSDSLWNGCNHEDTVWNGTVLHALVLYRTYLERIRDDLREKWAPKPDWLCITIDYHS